MLRCQERTLGLQTNPSWECQALATRVGNRIAQTQALTYLGVHEDEVIVQSYSLGITSLDRRKDALWYFMPCSDEALPRPDKHSLT